MRADWTPTSLVPVVGHAAIQEGANLAILITTEDDGVFAHAAGFVGPLGFDFPAIIGHAHSL